MSGETYFSFPLCLLSHGADHYERLETIISYSYVEAGRDIVVKIDNEAGEKERIERVMGMKRPAGFVKSNWVHSAIVLGAKLIGINPASVEYTEGRYNKARQFIKDFEVRNGANPLVRIRKDLVFEVRDKRGMSYREFSVLCAVYSCIGDKKHPIAIRRVVVAPRALGYKNMTVFMKEKNNRTDSMEILTEWQVRDTLAKLHALGFYARAQASKTSVYYSHRMTDLELRQHLLKSKTYMAEFKSKQRAADDDLMKQLKEKRQRLNPRKTTTISATQPRPRHAKTLSDYIADMKREAGLLPADAATTTNRQPATT